MELFSITKVTLKSKMTFHRKDNQSLQTKQTEDQSKRHKEAVLSCTK